MPNYIIGGTKIISEPLAPRVRGQKYDDKERKHAGPVEPESLHVYGQWSKPIKWPFEVENAQS